MAGSATCALTRAIAFYATHSYSAGGTASRHGHLYRVEVTIGGIIAPGHEMLIDLATLDDVLTQEIAQSLEGRHLNEAMTDSPQSPSCEAVAAWCWRRVAPRLPTGVALERVRVYEDLSLWADCTGAA